MQQIFRAVLFAFLAVLLTSLFLSGCTAPCNYPDQRGVIVRVLNAMPDMPMITVFINGKVFVQNYTYDPPTSDLYLTSYKDGSSLNAGDSVLFVATSDASGKDTVATGKISLNFNRQTVIVMGRGHIKTPMRKTSLILRLDDQEDQPNVSQTLVRFVNAVPDLDSLDVYFKGDTSGKSLGKPDLTIHYGEILPHMLLNSVSGLTITEAGHPSNVIFTIGYPFAFPGFFVTVVIRGESKPLGIDFLTAPIVLSDVVPGVYLYPFKTFAVRLVNASRALQLNMLIRSTYVSPEDTLQPRANYPNQSVLFNIAAGKISDYLPMNISLDSIAGYWFSASVDPKDTLVSSVDNAHANFRFSKIAVEELPVGGSGKKVSYLSLPDTMTIPPASNFGRVRLINLSPDHSSITVTIGGNTITMNRKDVRFLDLPIGSQTITLKEGTNSTNQTINVSPITPISIYLLPEQSATTKFPIATSQD